jgi:hypothetical protein
MSADVGSADSTDCQRLPSRVLAGPSCIQLLGDLGAGQRRDRLVSGALPARPVSGPIQMRTDVNKSRRGKSRESGSIRNGHQHQ